MIHPILKYLSSYIILLGSRYWRLSYLLGSGKTYLSGATIALPLLFEQSIISGCIIWIINTFIHLSMSPHPLLSLLVYHLPGLAAAAYWSVNSRLLKLFVALACMILFVVHPIGVQVSWYALFWLIPIAATFVKNSYIARAIGTTWTAHAVGTVGWLYMHSTTPSFWAGLVPIVIAERVLYAALLYSTWYIAQVDWKLVITQWRIHSGVRVLSR
ncbi:hypothetical protein J120_01075 [candidate division TM6 bacterium JCVI TM6SC1]|uniref:Uncharacterized protein n=1 Tax=candidate division TM6 bacterium JCVI TM6SC1 TaxID=1306947 RepID=A0A0D2JMG8_9BACT|nr:hypothetical protein J120_01075 [candidate division TM6 bacterium JCVI TM6SC1]